jgi:hypothetical protein
MKRPLGLFSKLLLFILWLIFATLACAFAVSHISGFILPCPDWLLDFIVSATPDLGAHNSEIFSFFAVCFLYVLAATIVVGAVFLIIKTARRRSTS